MTTVLQNTGDMTIISQTISHFKFFRVTRLSLLCTCESVFKNPHSLFFKTPHTNFTPDVS